jgi:hypothetical protein
VAGPLTSWYHLVRRFFGFLNALPLSPREQAEVCGLLTGTEAALFWEQRDEDQRHALQVTHRALKDRPGDREVATAALLHDVGKRRVRMGAVQRSLATTFDHVGFPMPHSYRTYCNHGVLGAGDLEEAGSGALAVEFARHHPSGVPPGIDGRQWQALLDADHG